MTHKDEARHEPAPQRRVRVEASIRLPHVAIELCAFPAPESETHLVIEQQSVLTLGLSGRPSGSEGRFRRHEGTGFARFGVMSFRPAGVPIEMRVPAGSWHVIRCRFDEGALRDVIAEPLGDAELAACFDIRSTRIEDAMLRLADEVAGGAPDARELATGLMAVMLVDFGRYLRNARDLTARRRGGLAPRHLRRVLARIEEPGPPPAVRDLAALCGLSQFHFIRSFRESIGASPGVFIQHARITRAKSLLAASERPLAEIARELGYAGAAPFSAAFRRASGRSPGSYRACLRQE